MKLAAVRFYVMIAVSGVILLAGLVLLVLQWGNDAKFSLYGKNTYPPTWLLMLASAVAGLVAWSLIRVLWRGVVGLRRLHRSGAPAGTDSGA